MRSAYSDLFCEIDGKTLVVSATERLSEHLFSLFMQDKQASDKSVSFSEPFISLQRWLAKIYGRAMQHNIELPQLFSAEESLFLFSKILHEDSRVLMPGDKAARLALSAYQLLKRWQVPLSELETGQDNLNVAHLVRWMNAFEKDAKHCCAIDQSQLLSELILSGAFVSVLRLQRITTVYFVGFDVFPPDVRHLIDVLKKAQLNVRQWQLPEIQHALKNITYRAYQSDEAELNQVACEVAQFALQHRDSSIGVIVPDLQRQFDKLQKAFDTVFLDQVALSNPVADNAMRPYTISGGRPLACVSIILQLLKWLNIDAIEDFQTLTDILQSPYIKGASQNRQARQAWVYALKRECFSSATLAEILKKSHHLPPPDEALAHLLQGVAKQKTAGSYDVKTFVEKVKSRLHMTGWPGEMRLESLEYQAVRKFYLLLNRLSSFDRLAVTLTFKGWLKQLEKLCQGTLFQTENNPRANVHILGMLESADITFDKLFIIRMSDATWPSVKAAHPFLPYDLQKRYHMPHAGVERELRFAELVTKRLLRQAPYVAFSFAQQNEDRRQHPSPLLTSLTPVALKQETFEGPKAPVACQRIENVLTPVSDEEKRAIKGGTALFKNMAECPYRAQLVHRLGILAYPEHRTLLNAVEKGVVMHHVLETVWCELRNSSALKALSFEDECLLIERHIDAAFKRYPDYLSSAPRFTHTLEKRRLKRLVQNWLSYEKKRVTDFQVEALEKRLNIALFGLNLSFRVDRIDRLEQGVSVVIDYKTSKSFEIKRLLQSPIKEPQLPLYAVYQETDAVAIAMVSGKSVAFKALGDIGGWISEGDPKPYPEGVRKDQLPEAKTFSALKAYWQSSLNLSVRQFLSGAHDLTPSPKNCAYCRFGEICRVKYH